MESRMRHAGKKRQSQGLEDLGGVRRAHSSQQRRGGREQGRQVLTEWSIAERQGAGEAGIDRVVHSGHQRGDGGGREGT